MSNEFNGNVHPAQFHERCIERALTTFKKRTKRAIPENVASEVKRGYIAQQMRVIECPQAPDDERDDGPTGGELSCAHEWEDLQTRFAGKKNQELCTLLLRSWGAQLKRERGRESVLNRISGLKSVKVSRKTYERIESGTPVDAETWIGVYCELGYTGSIEELFRVESWGSDRREGVAAELRMLIAEQWQSYGQKTQLLTAQKWGVHVQTYRRIYTDRNMMIDTWMIARVSQGKYVNLERNVHKRDREYWNQIDPNDEDDDDIIGHKSALEFLQRFLQRKKNPFSLCLL